MRLIDADKVLQEKWEVETKDMFHMMEMVEVVSAMDIKEAPTVEAIPIEWLKNELIPKAEKIGATEYAINIRFVLEDWEAWKKYHG